MVEVRQEEKITCENEKEENSLNVHTAAAVTISDRMYGRRILLVIPCGTSGIRQDL